MGVGCEVVRLWVLVGFAGGNLAKCFGVVLMVAVAGEMRNVEC